MSKIGKVEWLIIYIVAIIIDIIQIFFPGLDLLADVAIGFTFFFYFKLRGVDLIKHPTRLISLLGFTALAETLSVGIAPAWIVDIWYIHKNVRNDDKIFKAQQEETEQYAIATTLPLNQNGVRNPQPPIINSSDKPMNRSGIRQPRRN